MQMNGKNCDNYFVQWSFEKLFIVTKTHLVRIIYHALILISIHFTVSRWLFDLNCANCCELLYLECLTFTEEFLYGNYILYYEWIRWFVQLSSKYKMVVYCLFQLNYLLDVRITHVSFCVWIIRIIRCIEMRNFWVDLNSHSCNMSSIEGKKR